jgi:NADPH:quinone reductase-like Zn-dependent oxidoreductase
MKAAILNGYDKNGRDLVLEDIPIPEVGDQEALIRIHTAGVNPLDNMIIRGEVKMIVPYKLPLVMGNEFVGVIEKVGAGVGKHSVGDRVYGRMPLGKIGAFAEFAAVHQDAIAKVPE